MRIHGLSVAEAGATPGRMHLLGGALGTVTTALVVGSPALRDSRRVLKLLAAGVAIASVPSVLAFWTDSLPVTVTSLWIVVRAIYFFIGPR